jgi:hypothetical protein
MAINSFNNLDPVLPRDRRVKVFLAMVRFRSPAVAGERCCSRFAGTRVITAGGERPLRRPAGLAGRWPPVANVPSGGPPALLAAGNSTIAAQTTATAPKAFTPNWRIADRAGKKP